MTPEVPEGEGKEPLVKHSLIRQVRERLASNDMTPFFVGGEISSIHDYLSTTTFKTIFYIAPKYPFYDPDYVYPIGHNVINRMAMHRPVRGRLTQYDANGNRDENYMFLGTIGYDELIAIRRTRSRKITTVFQDDIVATLGADLAATETVSDHAYQRQVVIVLMPDVRLAYLAGLTRDGNLNMNAADTLLLEARLLNFKALRRLKETSDQAPEFINALSSGKTFTRDELYSLMFGKKSEREFQKLQLSRK